MDFQAVQSKINVKKLTGRKARKLIYDYIHKLNKGTKRGTRNFTTQFLCDMSRQTATIEVYKMGKNEDSMELVFTFGYHDGNGPDGRV